MPTTSSTTGSLIEALRQILKDTNFLSRQIDIVISTGAAGLVSVIDGALSVTATTITQDYLFSQYPTMADLVAAVNQSATNGNITAELVQDGDPDHATADLQLMPPTNALGQHVLLSTRMWSDDELDNMVTRAINRHNMSIPADATLRFRGNYSAMNLPSEHEYFVLLLAQIEALKTQIQSSSKRKGTDLSVTDFVALKGALEREYADQLKLFFGRRTTPTAADVKDIGSGDVIEGQTYRQSLHTGPRYPYGPRIVPSAAAPKPVAVHLTASALGSGQVMLQWGFNRDSSFNRYEVWRGATPAVSDISDFANPLQTVTPTGIRIATTYYRNQTLWVDGAATPVAAGVYYYVVYVFNTNNDGTPSNAVVVTVT